MSNRTTTACTSSYRIRNIYSIFHILVVFIWQILVKYIFKHYLFKGFESCFPSEVGQVWENGFFNFLEKRNVSDVSSTAGNYALMHLSPLPGFCRVLVRNPELQDSWQNWAGPPDQGPRCQSDTTADRSCWLRTDVHCRQGHRILLTCRLSPWTKTWATGPLRTYTFSIFSGAMYSPWASLKMFFFRSMIFRTPLCRQ